MTRKPCIGCGVLLTGRGRRCSACSRRHEARRAPQRVAYRDPAYRALRPSGTCWTEGCRNPATTKDHIVPLMFGGTNHPANIAFLCRACNSRKGATTE